MKENHKFFKKKILPVDKFLQNVLYDKKFGYYNSRFPFGAKGDFITAPKISSLFSEMIAIWIIYTWEKIGKPKFLNIIELGPGDGSLAKELLKVFERFSEFNSVHNFYLYEKSNLLINFQKNNIKNKKVKWIKNFKKIKKGPVIFFGNEFFDAIPIKQFKKEKKDILEKYLVLKENNKIKDIFKKAKKEDLNMIRKYKSLRNLKFIEFPKNGLEELEKITRVISKQKGCLLIIDYGYLKSKSADTLQSVKNHKKNYLFNNLGKADITSLVNFKLLKEFFIKNNLKVKNIISQREFLEKLGIIQRAEMLAKKMGFKEKTNLYLRLRRLLSPKLMGKLFKVILAYKFDNNKYSGF